MCGLADLKNCHLNAQCQAIRRQSMFGASQHVCTQARWMPMVITHALPRARVLGHVLSAPNAQVQFYCDVQQDPFELLAGGGTSYGFNMVMEELPGTVDTLGKTTAAFAKVGRRCGCARACMCARVHACRSCHRTTCPMPLLLLHHKPRPQPSSVPSLSAM